MTDYLESMRALKIITLGSLGFMAALPVTLCTVRARADDSGPPGGEKPPIVVDVAGHKREPSYAPAYQTTATRARRPVADVPQAITVVDRDLMNDLDARRTDDALPYVPGVQIYDSYGGVFDDYLVRGFHVWAGTVFRDGYLNGYSGGSTTDAINVERIEVIRGPASALYGPALPGGSINFVIKRPLAKRHFELGASVGSFDTYRGEIDATGPASRRVRYRLMAAAESTSGYREFNTFNRWLVNPQVEVDLAKGTSVFAEAQAFDVHFRSDPLGTPEVGGDPFYFPTERSYTEPFLPLSESRGYLGRVELQQRLGKRWSLRMGTQSRSGLYHENELYWRAPDADGRTLSRYLSNFEVKSADTILQVAVHGTADTGPLSHSVVVGTDLGHEQATFRAASTEGTGVDFPIDLFSPAHVAALPDLQLPDGPPNGWSYRVAGLYANDLIGFSPVKLAVGARVDDYVQESHVGDFRDHESALAFSPRGGVVVDVIHGVSVYGNVSRGFWPSLGVDGNTGGVLKAETNFAYEGGVRGALDDNRATLDLAAFHIDDKNKAVTDPDNPSFQQQVGEAVSQGFEAQAAARLHRLLRVFASYAYTDVTITSNALDPSQVGQQFPLVAKNTAAVWGQVDVPTTGSDQLGVGVGVTYRGERSLLDGAMVPGFARVDSVLSYATPTVRTSLRVENLLDTRYVKGGLTRFAVLQGAPRNLMLTGQLFL